MSAGGCTTQNAVGMSTSAPDDQNPEHAPASRTDIRGPAPPPGVWKDPVVVAALGFGAGAVPYVPGTAGTLLAVGFYLLIAHVPALGYVGIVIALFLLGVWICGHAERVIAVHDHPSVVWDEIVGYLVAMFLAPAGWLWILAGFALFRLFDIWKPFPIRIVERRVQGGLGTMLDDVVAGLYAWISLQIAVLLSGVL